MTDPDGSGRERPEWFDTLVLVAVASVVVIVAVAGLLWWTRPAAEPVPAAASDAAAGTVASSSASATPAPSSTTVADETTAPAAASPVPNTAVAPEPGSGYGDLSDSQIDAFVTSMALPSLPADTLVGLGRSSCTILDSIRSEGPLDKNNVEQVRAELDETVSLLLADGAALSVFGAGDAERQLRRIDHFAAKFFCPPFYPAVAAAHPEITE